MRVLLSFPGRLDGHATATSARNQVLGLHDLGVQVTVFVTTVGDAGLPDGVRVHETRRFGPQRKLRVPHRAISAPQFHIFHDLIVSRFVARNAERYDVVHAWPRACLHTLRAARSAGVRALRESPNEHTASGFAASAQACRDIGVGLPPDHSHRFDAEVLAREEAEYAAASGILVPSEFVRASFIARNWEPDRLLRHSYGCDIGHFTPDPRPRDARQPFRAAFIGRGDPTKGLHVALEAWRRSGLSESGRLEVCGSVMPEYAAAMKETLADPSVHVRGFLADVAPVHRDADVLLLPSWTEGSALVAMEAQASGSVPLVSEACGQLGTPGETSLVHRTGDVDGLVMHLDSLNRDRDRLARMRANCIAMRDAISWQAAARRLAAAYELAARLPN
jgi:D-inositol-3-phosphate glycosyltransferase